MLTIRLARIGKPKHPFYRFIVSEKSRDPWGKALEILGTFDPLTKPEPTVILKKDRIQYWLSKGAQCSDTAWNILLEQKVVEGERRKHLQISKRRKEKLTKKQPAPAAA